MTAPPEPLTQPARNVPERLSVALQAAWEDLSECTNEISQASAAVQAAPSAAPNLMAIRDWYQETTRVLLTEPVKKFMRLQPIRRTLGAMRACDQEISAAAVHPESGRMPISSGCLSSLHSIYVSHGGFGAAPIIRRNGAPGSVAASGTASKHRPC